MHLFLIRFCLAVLLLCLPLSAATLSQQWQAAGAVQVADIELSLDEAVEMVRRKTGGRVLSADRVERDGRTWYRIRVLVAEGKVRVYRVDPATGRMR